MRLIKLIPMMFVVLAGSITPSLGQETGVLTCQSGEQVVQVVVDPNAGRFENSADYPHVVPSVGSGGWMTVVLYSKTGVDATALTNLAFTTGLKSEPGYNRRVRDINGDTLLDLLVDADVAEMNPLSLRISVTASSQYGNCSGTAPVRFGSYAVREIIQLNITDHQYLNVPYCPSGANTCTVGVDDAEIRVSRSGSPTPADQLAAKFSEAIPGAFGHTSLCRTQIVKGTNKANSVDSGQCYAGFDTYEKYEQIVRWVEPRSQTTIYTRKTWTADQHNTDKNGLTHITDNISIVINADGSVTVPSSQTTQVLKPGDDPYNRLQ